MSDPGWSDMAGLAKVDPCNMPCHTRVFPALQVTPSGTAPSPVTYSSG